MLALLASISSTVRSARDSSLPEGSPTMVVPPPISVIGFLSPCCSPYSILMVRGLPVCSRGLQPIQHHHGQVVADVQRWRRAVVADIGGCLASRGERVEAFEIGTLMDEA